MKKEYIIAIIVGVILLVASLLIYNNLNTKEDAKGIKSDVKNDIKEETPDVKEEIPQVQTPKEKTFNLNNANINDIIYCPAIKCIINIDSFGQLITEKNEKETEKMTITLNGKILKEDSYHFLADIKIINSLLYIEFKAGWDITGTSFGVYNKDATAIVSYEVNSITNNLPDKFGQYIVADIKVDEKTIEFISSNVGNSHLFDIDTDLCNKDVWIKLPLKGETVVSKKYTITYLGNSKYSEPVIKNDQTIIEVYKDSCE